MSFSSIRATYTALILTAAINRHPFRVLTVQAALVLLFSWGRSLSVLISLRLAFLPVVQTGVTLGTIPTTSSIAYESGTKFRETFEELSADHPSLFTRT